MPSKAKTELLQVVEGQETAQTLPEVSTSEAKLTKSVADKTPEAIAQIENVGTAMMQTAQEFLLVIEDALKRHHGWNDAQLKQLHQQITPVLHGVAEYEKQGLSLLSPRDIGIVAELVETRLHKERSWRAGIETPILAGATPFLLKLHEKNNPKAKTKKGRGK